MKIETKYEINQEVWFIEDDKVKSEPILKITFSKSIFDEDIIYHFEDRQNSAEWQRYKKEYEVFSTKENLIKSL